MDTQPLLFMFKTISPENISFNERSKLFEYNKRKSSERNVSAGLIPSIHLYIYIYIYCPPQTDCFVLSVLFSVARHVGRLKPGSKPVEFCIRISLRPLGQQAYHVG